MYPKLLAKRLLTVILYFAMPFLVYAQQKIITGNVTSEKDGIHLNGVSIIPKNGKGGTQTDGEGNFRLSVPATVSVLQFSYVGYTSQDVDITGQSTVNVILKASGDQLNEVIVIGYGTARKRDVTGSVVSVTAKDFNQGVITSPDQLLQNKVAGLEVTNNSGQPGAATTVKIRGNNSIRASNNPLYVVDGVPLDGRTARPSLNLGNNGLGFGTTPESNPLLYINPNDIESFEVLKDASSAAIYGSRGANGVILITTKKGSSGAPKLEVATNVSVSDYMKKFKVLTASQFRTALVKDSVSNSFDGGVSTDALKAISQNAFSQNYSLSLTGGGENGRYRATFLAGSNKGLLRKSSLDKYLASIAGQYKFMDKKLSIDFNLIGGHTTENLSGVSNGAGSEGNVLSAALIWNPTVSLYDSTGKYYNLSSNGVSNPLAFNDAFSDVANVNVFLFNIAAGYTIAKGLNYKFLYAINHGAGDRNTNIEGFVVGFVGFSGNGYAVVSNAKLTSQTFTHTLNYRTNISKDLVMDAVAGYEYWKTSYSNSNIAAKGFNTNIDQTTRIPIPYTSIMQNASTQYPLTTVVDPSSELQSYFIRANFNFKDRYVITGTLRADGSSKFGSANRYGYFPSVGARWAINNEDFMKTSRLFTNLSLRGSWGITGNQEFPAGASLEQYGVPSYNTVNQSIVANPNLKWESTKSYNVGLDFAILKGKLSGSFDYYNKNTSNILFQATAIQPAPSSIYFINIPANLINKGYEISLSAAIIEHKSFGWDATVNFANNKNNLKNFTDINTKLPLVIQTGRIDGQGVSATFAQVITNNKPVDEFFLKKFNGFDAKGNQTIDANPSYAGDPNPHTLLGFSTTLRYEKFTLTVNAGGAFGYMIYNNTATSVTNINGITSGRNIDLKAYNSGESKSSGAAASTRFLEKGDYMKLRNATIRYSFGNQGKYIKNLSAYISGTNLFVITKFSGFDPEVNVDKSNNNYPSRSIEYIPYPTARTFTFGLNFSL